MLDGCGSLLKAIPAQKGDSSADAHTCERRDQLGKVKAAVSELLAAEEAAVLSKGAWIQQWTVSVYSFQVCRAHVCGADSTPLMLRLMCLATHRATFFNAVPAAQVFATSKMYMLSGSAWNVTLTQ